MKKQKAALPSQVLQKWDRVLNHPVFIFSALAVCILITFLFLQPNPYDYDMWWQIRYGERHLHDHTFIVDQTQFSWTPANDPWIYNTWVGGSLLYLIYVSTGATGLLIYKWLTFIMVILLFYFYYRKSGNTIDWFFLMAVTLVSSAFVLNGTLIKPERMGDLFLALVLFLYVYSILAKKSYFLLYPVIFLVWVNTHGSFISGLAAVTLLWGGSVFSFFVMKNKDIDIGMLKKLSLSTILSYGALVINPYGVKYPLFWLQQMSSSSTATKTAIERLYAWKSMWSCLLPGAHDFKLYFFTCAWTLCIMFFIFMALALYRWKKERALNLPLLLLNISFFFISMQLSRATVYYPLIWCFSMAFLVKEQCFVPIKRVYLTVSLVLFIVFLSFHGWSAFSIILPENATGVMDRDFVPVEEARFVKEKNLPGPIFNDYLSGGYLMWALFPDYKVFIDPRQKPYQEQVIPDFFGLQDRMKAENLDLLTAKYGFRTAFIHLQCSDFLQLFLASPSWKLVYFHKNAAIFVRIDEYTRLATSVTRQNLSPYRFSKERNPLILSSLSIIYSVNDPSGATQIDSYFKHNVSKLYYRKPQ